MTPTHVLLRRCCESVTDCAFVVPRLALRRTPRNRLESQEIALWTALAPILRAHPGDFVAIRRACPSRWIHALDSALELPQWFVDRAEPTRDLLAVWLDGRSRGWELPDRVLTAMPVHLQRRVA